MPSIDASSAMPDGASPRYTSSSDPGLIADTTVSTSSSPDPGAATGSATIATSRGPTKCSASRLDPCIDEPPDGVAHTAQRILLHPAGGVDARVVGERLRDEIDRAAADAGDVAVHAGRQLGLREAPVVPVHDAGRAARHRLDHRQAEALLPRRRDVQPRAVVEVRELTRRLPAAIGGRLRRIGNGRDDADAVDE